MTMKHTTALSVALGIWLLVGTVVIAMAATAGSDRAYQLAPNDTIRIQVFGEDDLTVETKIGVDGKIHYPLVGAMPIAGKTVAELQDYITRRLADGYLKHPKVTVLLTKHRNFFVGGEVKTPGGYPYEGGLTVQKAIAIAGGMTEKAEIGRIEVTRVRDGAPQSLIVEGDALVQPDDLIVVAQAKKVYVTGEVKKPGEYPYEKGLTVHRAITLAGGLTDKAAERRAQILRVINEEERTISVKLDSPVLPEDIVLIPESFF
jgi:protein involved in polysaccharide export with SLBB domain